MPQTPTAALRIARVLLDSGIEFADVLANPALEAQNRAYVEAALTAEAAQILIPARLLAGRSSRRDWLPTTDRSSWYYWPTLRTYLLDVKNWSGPGLRSLDDASDRVLRLLAPPDETAFDIRGLVVGFVQSGKTANYTSLIAKAADAGYRLVIVLAGIDNGLRRQTQLRLNKELVGYADSRQGAVPMPPAGRQWHQFTTEELDGDFRAGNVNHAALQGSQPVLMVIKKNGAVLRRLLAWLDHAPSDVCQGTSLLLIDDEADQASIDTRGVSGPHSDMEQYEEPSIINGLIRDLLSRFRRRAYVAYTATPFANVLIPHEADDPAVGADLFPKDFIVDLPKPDGYFGAEEFFGTRDPKDGDDVGGYDVIRAIPQQGDAEEEPEGAFTPDTDPTVLPPTLLDAITDFILAAAARRHRADGVTPSTMLIHTSHLVEAQGMQRAAVADYVAGMRDEWRYDKGGALADRLAARWAKEFVPRLASGRNEAFADIRGDIGVVLEAVQVLAVNSETGAVLDYEREPGLTAIAVGGNRLSRGLTLDGLIVSYFHRRSANYDTLMQMGRWFGYRRGYADLIRVYTTTELAGWFADLAIVERQLRDDIAVLEAEGLTPREVGMKIREHPALQVTSALKRRFATSTTIEQSYSACLEQTFRFPFSRPDTLAYLADSNLEAVKRLVAAVSEATAPARDGKGPIWRGVSPEAVLTFLSDYKQDDEARSLATPLIQKYIRKLLDAEELVRWTIAVRGREKLSRDLGSVDWGVGDIPQISRSRIAGTDSLGVITSGTDEGVGLPEEALRAAAANAGENGVAIGVALRQERAPEEGVLLLYPISGNSGREAKRSPSRSPLFALQDDVLKRNLVGIALSFPRSRVRAPVRAYLHGTVAPRLAE